MTTIQSSLIETPDTLLHALQPQGMRYTVTGTGVFRARYTRIDVGPLQVQSTTESLPRILEGQIALDRTGITFPLQPSAPVYCNGAQIGPADVAILGALGPQICHRIEGPSEWVSISLDVDGWMNAGPVLAGRNRPLLPNVPVLAPPAQAFERLKRLVRASIDLAGDVPDLLRAPEAARGLQNAMMEALVTCVTDDNPGPCRDAWRHHARIIGGFLEVLERDADKPLYLPEICLELGASDRTLRQACHEYFGMGPKRYLLLRRLHMARRALSAATPGSATVTSIATEFGFWELGRFATAYSRLFGEAPSATLRQPAGRARHDASVSPRSVPFVRRPARPVEPAGLGS